MPWQRSHPSDMLILANIIEQEVVTDELSTLCCNYHQEGCEKTPSSPGLTRSIENVGFFRPAPEELSLL
jgi:hypothetical protein